MRKLSGAERWQQQCNPGSWRNARNVCFSAASRAGQRKKTVAHFDEDRQEQGKKQLDFKAPFGPPTLEASLFRGWRLASNLGVARSSNFLDFVVYHRFYLLRYKRRRMMTGLAHLLAQRAVKSESRNFVGKRTRGVIAQRAIYMLKS